MNQILAYSFLLCVIVVAAIPIIGYIKSKYYHIDTTPIRYWLNKKQRVKKRYRTFKKRNRKNLTAPKIHRYSKYVKSIRNI